MRDMRKSFLSVGELNADRGEVEVAYAKLRGVQDGKAITGITITSATLNNNDNDNQYTIPTATTTTSPWLGPSSLPVAKDDTRDQEDTRGSKLSIFNDTNEVREIMDTNTTDNYGSFIQNDTGTYTMSVNDDTGTYSSDSSGTIDYLANMIFGGDGKQLRDDEGNIIERPPLNNIRGILGKLRVNADDNTSEGNGSSVIKDDMSIHALFNKADEVLATTPEVDHQSVSENTRGGVPQQVICTNKKNDDEEGGNTASLLKSSMSFVSQVGQEVELAKGHKVKAIANKTVTNKKKRSSKKMAIMLEGRGRSKNTSPVTLSKPISPKIKDPEETNNLSESSTMKSGETKKVENTKRLTIKGILHSPRYNGKKLMGSLSPNRSKNKRAVFKFDNNSPPPEVDYDANTDKADVIDITAVNPVASPNTTQPEPTQKDRTSSPAEESEAPTLMSWKDLRKDSDKILAAEGIPPTAVDDNITNTKGDALSVVTEYDDTKKKEIDDSTVEAKKRKILLPECQVNIMQWSAHQSWSLLKLYREKHAHQWIPTSIVTS